MSGRWMIAAAALAGMGILLSGGCVVSRKKYNEAVRAQRLARMELERSQAALQNIRVENQNLQADLARVQADLAGKNTYATKLEQGNKDLVAKFNALKALYDKLSDMPPGVGTVQIILPPGLDAALKALQRQNPELMEYLPQYGMVKIKSDLTFAKGSAVVKDSAAAALKRLADIMQSPEAKAFYVYAAGHTDDIPLVNRATIEAHGSNWGLSLHRAGAVVKILAVGGIEQRRLGAMGFSKYHPVAPNRPGNRGNPLNRRVEMWIVPPDRFLTSVSAPEPEK